MLGYNWCPPNIGARSQSSGTGTTVSSTTANTKGSWVDVGATLSFDCGLLSVSAVTGAAQNAIFDIGINVGGNRFVIAEDLRCTSGVREGTSAMIYELPIRIKAGAQISMRHASQFGSTFVTAKWNAYGRGVGGFPGFARCRALYTQANCMGPAIDPGGSANTKGAYTQLVASSGFNVSAFMFAVGPNSDVGRAAAARAAMDIAIGAGGSEQIILPDLLFGWSSVMDIPYLGCAPVLPFYIPSGTRIAARGQCTITTAGDRTWDLAAWGFEA